MGEPLTFATNHMLIIEEPLDVNPFDLKAIITYQYLWNPKPTYDVLPHKFLNTPLGNSGDCFSFWPFHEITTITYFFCLTWVGK